MPAAYGWMLGRELQYVISLGTVMDIRPSPGQQERL